MKIFLKSFFLSLMLLGVVKVNAQDITISSTDLVNLKNEIQQLKDSIKTLNDTISSKVSIIESKSKSITDLSLQINSLRIDCDNLKREKDKNDTIITKLRSNEEACNIRMQSIQETLDRNTAKLANGRLYFKYSDNLVQPSILSLLELKTEKVKKDFDQALRLLQSYKAYSEDVKNTFVALQSIDKDEWKSKHQANEYKNKCLTILRQSQYYKNVYSKKSNIFWSIPYLDNLLNIAKSIISRHNPVESEFANFTPLIEML